MVKKILIVLVIAFGALLLLAARQPDSYTVERRLMMNASPEAVFAQLNDFHNWTAWSPWAKLDPAMKETYSGAPSGPGAIYEWSGNSDVGAGRMEIKAASAPTRADFAVDFLSPMESHALFAFELTPMDRATEVIWTMRGNSDFVTKLMSVFTSMDAMVGPDFEKGLAQLKAVVEP
jgi:hypothetical protein